MIQSKLLDNGWTYTWSDINMKIMQETGLIFEDAEDTVPHTYTETDIPIEDDTPAETQDYQEALRRIGVDLDEQK